MNINEIQDCICDLYDIKKRLTKEILSLPKDNDGTETTISDCLENVIEKLTQEEENQ
jgi:hypothetical protein